MHLGDNPYVIGIVLSISTHSGPHLVYKYERDTPLNYLDSQEHKLYNDASDSESSLYWSQSDDEEDVTTTRPRKVPFESLKSQFSALVEEDVPDMGRRSSVGGTTEKQELVFGFDRTSLAEMLCPPRSMCNKRFELNLGDYEYLGIPVHVGESGKWTRDKESEKAGETEEKEEVDDDNIASLRMFHVCFVLNPPITETQYVCDELYHHVLVQLATLLRHEQRTKDYVWKEIKTIFECEDNGLEHLILQRSELARALKTLFTSISKLEIAHLVISGKVRPFQVPVDSEVHRIPMFVGQDVKLWGCQPTTAKNPDKEVEKNCPDCYGLLLLDDPEKILKRIEAEPTGPLAALVFKINPTLSLEQMAKENNIPTKQMVNLAYSLVYWRCASIIIPLNHRFIYAVSPLAPMGRIYELDKAFRGQFPMMPPLQRVMSTLSTGKPQHYANHIPSRDHHLVYMDVLAWMFRHNLVVHVQTLVIIFVPRKIKLEVLREHDEESQDQDSGSSDQEQRQDFAHDNSTKRKGLVKTNVHKWNAYEDYEQLMDSFVTCPTRATLQEKKWIFKIASKHPADLQNLFYRMLKYFNGKDCMEQAFMHEKIPRTEQRRFLQAYAEHLIPYRHW